jgi:hypothetical protein
MLLFISERRIKKRERERENPICSWGKEEIKKKDIHKTQ